MSQTLVEMSYRSIQHEVDELFDRADHANIAYKDDSDFTYLMKTRKLPITPKLSVDIIKDVL